MESNAIKTDNTCPAQAAPLPSRAGLRLMQGALIGLGAVLPGISGGVLCVVFGVYKTIMGLLSHPVRTLKKEYRALLPLVLGVCLGFVVVAKVLGFLLNRYPNPSVCLFVGLIGGMLPSLFREAGERGREKGSFLSLGICFAVVLGLLLGLSVIQLTIVPNRGWYLFCGFCMALSMIVPGMSFSTLLMPLGLYTPFVTGIGSFDSSVLLPALVGVLLTVVLLAKAVDHLMETHYSLAFHGIIGIVIAATLVIIPFQSFTESVSSCLINLACMGAGAATALLLDRFNQSVQKPEL